VTRTPRPVARSAGGTRTSRGRGQAGFTVLELIVILAMIGVLLGVGIPTLIRYINSGSNTAAQNNVVTALQAANAYYVENTQTYAGLCVGPHCNEGPGLGFAGQGANVSAVGPNTPSTTPTVVSIFTNFNGSEVIITALANSAHNCWAVIEDRGSGTVQSHKAPVIMWIREKQGKLQSEPTCNAGAPVYRSAIADVTISNVTATPTPDWPSGN
jgi:type II secretory pathway pseudopilin PulG